MKSIDLTLRTAKCTAAQITILECFWPEKMKKVTIIYYTSYAKGSQKDPLLLKTLKIIYG